MSIESACQWLQNLDFATQIRESGWLFPTIETIHVLALVLVVGSIMTVDLRLLGVGNRGRSLSALSQEMLPWTWCAFGVAALAGFLMFSSKAVDYYGNAPFRLKMICLLLAGINMTYFNLVTRRDAGDWDLGRPPANARFAGGASLLLWVTIVAAGRWIGFTIKS
jgi:hypothetical protein